MKKIFVSVPMRGRTEEAIKASITKMKKIAEAYEGEELELIDSYIPDAAPECNNQRLWYLGESIKKLADADVFVGVWECIDDFVGCEIEKIAARGYHIKSYILDIDNVCPDVVLTNKNERALETDIF